MCVRTRSEPHHDFVLQLVEGWVGKRLLQLSAEARVPHPALHLGVVIELAVNDVLQVVVLPCPLTTRSTGKQRSQAGTAQRHVVGPPAA